MNDLFENWDQTKGALLEGLSSSNRSTVDRLMENQKNYILESASDGSTSAHGIANIRKSLMPVIRRVIPGTIATEIVGVQPMSGPAAQIFTLRHQYEEAAGPGVFPTGSAGFGETGATVRGDEVFGNDSPLRRFYSSASDAHPAGSGAFPVDDALAGTSASGMGAGSEQAAHMAAPDGYEVGAADPATLLGPYVGNYRGGSGSYLEGTGGRKMGIKLLSQTVEARTRKLQASWTIEAMQDLSGQHGVDIESEMVRAMSSDIVQEIDQEIISDLVALAGTAATFDGAGAGVYGGGAAGNYAPAFIGDRLANIGPMINYVANEIARKTRKGAGNFIVVSPLIVSVLQSAAKSVFAPAVQGAFKGPNNTSLVGTLNGTIKVYSYLWNQAGNGVDMGDATAGGASDTILVGYKGGDRETDAGYFYCPYIPVMSSGQVINSTTYQPQMSIMTRYGRATFEATETSLGNSSDYYGKIQVVDLDFT